MNSKDFKNPVIARNIASQIEYKEGEPGLKDYLFALILFVIGIIILAISFHAAKQQSNPRTVQRTNQVQVRLAVVREDTDKTIRYVNTSKARASWYNRTVCGKRIYGSTCKTALPRPQGEIFNDQDLTVAHRTLPHNTRVYFEYNNKSVVCRVNDRGPFVTGRTFDLSQGCAEAIGLTGVQEVNYKTLSYE